jgi:hypothetical protein
LICNDVLSKNPFNSNLINNVLQYKDVSKITMLGIINNLLVYYLKSIIYLSHYIVKKIIYSFHNQKSFFIKMNQDLIIIDTFLLVDDFKSRNSFRDNYFLGLDSFLNNSKEDFVYLPTLVGNKSFIDFNTIVKYSGVYENKIMLEQELLSYGDFIKMLFFILNYPFRVLSFSLRLKKNNIVEEHLRNEMLLNIRYVSVQNYSRYLIGKQLAKIPWKKLKIISWYENQVIDKSFYKGIKDTNKDVKIIGAKPYVLSDEVLNEIPDENEIISGTLPDIILVNSYDQIPKETNLNYDVGPSLRYKALLETKLKFDNRTKILVMLTIYDYEIRNVLNNIQKLDYPRKDILIKFHPTTKKQIYLNLVPNGVRIINESLLDIYNTIKITVGISTGALIEAACLGIPCILVPHPEKFSLKFFPKFGKGIIWDEVSEKNDINLILRKFNKKISLNNKELFKMSQDYRHKYFLYPTIEDISRAYLLN